MNSLEEFFDSVEADQAAHVEDVKDYALLLLSTSTMKDDDDGLEDEIIDTNPTPNRWREIFERLKLNQLRAIDLPNWSQTQFTESYQITFNFRKMIHTTEGVIKRVNKPMEFASGFRKCEIHLEVKDGQYTQIVPLEFLKDMVDEAISLHPGQKMQVEYKIQTREWQKTTDEDGNPLPEPGPLKIFCSFVVRNYSIEEETKKETQQPAPDGQNFPF